MYFYRLLWTNTEQFYPHSYVLLLWTFCVSIYAQVPVVEEIPHAGSAGVLFPLQLFSLWVTHGRNRNLIILDLASV
jgi:hypothetical protein